MSFVLKNKKVWKITFILTAIFLLWISTFGLLYHTNEMKIEGVKSDCLFSGQVEGCAMNFSEHITLWQKTIASLPQNTARLINSFILVILLVVAIVFWQNSFSLFSRRIASRFKLYIKQHPQINLFNYLGEVFSSGILNTKKYKLATI